jgi:apolipoprotein N-acyltransferase
LIAGAAMSIPLATLWSWPLALLSVAGLVVLLRGATPWRAATIGWLYGAAWIAASTWWLYISLHRYGDLPAPLAVASVALLALALATYLALACAVHAHLERRGLAPWVAALSFASLWLLAELARARLFTGFPWGASGYTQLESPLAAWAPWVGVYGVGFVLAFVASWVVLPQPVGARRGTAPRRSWWQRLAPLAIVPLSMLLPRDFTQPTSTLDVTLVQTNVPQDLKFDVRRIPKLLEEFLEALNAARGTLVVAPETSIPLLPSDLGPEGFAALERPFADGRRGALVGLPLGDFERGYTNSLLGLGGAPMRRDAAGQVVSSKAAVADAPLATASPTDTRALVERPPFARDNIASGAGRYRYDKHHLVPFGEFIPWGFRWFVNMMNIPLGDFARGSVVAPSFVVAGERIGPNVCYEDLFGEELAQRLVHGDAPTVFANASNIAWFGDSVAIDQHLNLSRMRSLELQRPMLRATNTGATAVIDHTGRVVSQLPRLERGMLDAKVTGRVGLTPYARWVGAAGGVWVMALMAALVVWAAWVFSRQRPQARAVTEAP